MWLILRLRWVASPLAECRSALALSAMSASSGAGHASAPAGPHPAIPPGGWAPKGIEDVTAEFAPQYLHTFVKPEPDQPVIMDRDTALALRGHLRASGEQTSFPFQRERVKNMNMAIKFVRYASTYADGCPAVLTCNLTHVGNDWRIPKFVRPDGGQYGFFDLRASGVSLSWDEIAACLPEPEFDKLFEEGILKVSIDYSDGPVAKGPGGTRWWMQKTPDYDIHFWTRDRRLSLHPQSTGELKRFDWAGHDEPFAPAGSRREQQ